MTAFAVNSNNMTSPLLDKKTTQQPPHKHYINRYTKKIASLLEESRGLASRTFNTLVFALHFQSLGTRLTPPKRVMLNQAIHLHRQTRKLVSERVHLL